MERMQQWLKSRTRDRAAKSGVCLFGWRGGDEGEMMDERRPAVGPSWQGPSPVRLIRCRRPFSPDANGGARDCVVPFALPGRGQGASACRVGPGGGRGSVRSAPRPVCSQGEEGPGTAGKGGGHDAHGPMEFHGCTGENRATSNVPGGRSLHYGEGSGTKLSSGSLLGPQRWQRPGQQRQQQRAHLLLLLAIGGGGGGGADAGPAQVGPCFPGLKPSGPRAGSGDCPAQ